MNYNRNNCESVNYNQVLDNDEYEPKRRRYEDPPNNMMPMPRGKRVNSIKCTKLEVSNISSSVQCFELSELFSSYGTVLNINIRNDDSRYSKSAEVIFKNANEAITAIRRCNGKNLHDNSLKVVLKCYDVPYREKIENDTEGGGSYGNFESGGGGGKSYGKKFMDNNRKPKNAGGFNSYESQYDALVASKPKKNYGTESPNMTWDDEESGGNSKSKNDYYEPKDEDTRGNSNTYNGRAPAVEEEENWD